jgi:hypothetical protein
MTPIAGYSAPPSYPGTPAHEWHLGSGGGGGSGVGRTPGTLSYQDYSLDPHSEQSEANMSVGKMSASQVSSTPMSVTSSVASAAQEEIQQMRRLPLGGGQATNSVVNPITGIAETFTIKNAPTLRGVEFVAQPTGASVAAGGGGMPPGASIAAGGGGAPAASLKSLGLVKALSSSASSSSSSSSSSQGPTSPTLAGSVRTRSGNVKSPKNQDQTGFRPSRKYPRKTRKARRSTTHRNRS